MKKCGFVWLAFILSWMCFVTGCHAGKNDSISSMPISNSQKNIGAYYMAGRIEAGEKAEISSKITARVLNISVDMGSTVKKGEPLIKLDTKDLEDQAAQAGANLSKAQAVMEGAQATYANAKSSNNRNQELFTTGGISHAQLEQSQTDLATAESALKSTQAQVDQARAALQLASTEVDNGIIVSPITGVISAKKINAGELATTGTQLLTVVNTDFLIVNAYLPASHLNQVKATQSVVIKVTQVPDKIFKGQISVIDSTINIKNNKTLVKVRFTDQDALIKPGMFAEIGLSQGGRK